MLDRARFSGHHSPPGGLTFPGNAVATFQTIGLPAKNRGGGFGATFRRRESVQSGDRNVPEPWVLRNIESSGPFVWILPEYSAA